MKKTPTVKKSKKIITAKTPISKIIEINPNNIEVLLESGLGCVGCHLSEFETLEQGCLGHGMTKKDVAEIIKKLNKK
jgi:hybrid cluster-associated redox disulfide protein